MSGHTQMTCHISCHIKQFTLYLVIERPQCGDLISQEAGHDIQHFLYYLLPFSEGILASSDLARLTCTVLPSF